MLLALAAVALVGALASPAPAPAAKPCWEQLLDDWLDGRIDGVYPARCYSEAVNNLPEDVEAYSDAREDIERALLGAMRDADGQLGPDDSVYPSTEEPSAEGSQEDREALPPLGSGGPDPGGGLIGAFGASNAASVPIPLVVLAALALALLSAGSIGFVARRIQARRLRVSPAAREGENL